MYRSHQHAFSLVELSIVLVILGLLVGGILTGQNLIRAAELRSVPADAERFVAAAFTFKSKYRALPGDMTRATNFWTAAHSTPATCYTTPSTGKETCNGDGDGFINGPTSDIHESFRFWQHLANAGLIEGSYIGTDARNDGYATGFVRGVNAPSGRIGDSYWWVNITNPTAANIFSFAVPEKINTLTLSEALPPPETWGVDKKIDDGEPHSGKMTAAKWGDCTDVDGTAATSGSYDLKSESGGCTFFINPW